MKIEELIKQATQLRDAVRTAITESEQAAPHLANAAGALGIAVHNLEGHLVLSPKTAPGDGVKKTPVTVPADGATHEVKVGGTEVDTAAAPVVPPAE